MNKKVVKKLLAMGVSVSLLVSGVAAGNYASAAKKLNVSAKKITLYVGKKKTIKTNLSAKFSVSNKKIVSLKKVKKKQCTVVAKKKGSCTITVKAGKQVKKIKVTVKKVTPVKTKAPTIAPTMEVTAPPTEFPVTTVSPTAVVSTRPAIPAEVSPTYSAVPNATKEVITTPSVAPAATEEVTAEPTEEVTVASTEKAEATQNPLETIVPTVIPEEKATLEPIETPKVNATVEPSETPVVTPSAVATPTAEPTNVPENLSVENTVNYFGFSMLDQLKEDSNVVISPYSIMMAMTLLDNAADGQSKAEIEKALGISDLDKWNEEFSAYFKQYMNQDETNKDLVLHSVNAIWKNDTNFSFDSEMQKNYFDQMLSMYSAMNESMDFTNGNPKDQINKWVNEQTKEMIPELIQEPIDNKMESVLVNALCFSGEWETQFVKSSTRENAFYGKNKTTQVDMMYHGIKSFKYIEDGSLAVAEFPFSDGNMAMDVVLAKDDASTMEEFQKLSNQEKVELFEKVGKSRTKTMNVYLPKFKMTYGTKDLTEQLKSMGISSVFDYNKAELPSLKGNNPNNIYVKDVLHQSVVEVAEGGVKASASTAVRVVSTAAPRIEVEFNVNKPFVYVIRDKSTNMIYFVGQVEDLTEENAIEDSKQSSDEEIRSSMSPTYPPNYGW